MWYCPVFVFFFLRSQVCSVPFFPVFTVSAFLFPTSDENISEEMKNTNSPWTRWEEKEQNEKKAITITASGIVKKNQELLQRGILGENVHFTLGNCDGYEERANKCDKDDSKKGHQWRFIFYSWVDPFSCLFYLAKQFPMTWVFLASTMSQHRSEFRSGRLLSTILCVPKDVELCVS